MDIAGDTEVLMDRVSIVAKSEALFSVIFSLCPHEVQMHIPNCILATHKQLSDGHITHLHKNERKLDSVAFHVSLHISLHQIVHGFVLGRQLCKVLFLLLSELLARCHLFLRKSTTDTVSMIPVPNACKLRSR